MSRNNLALVGVAAAVAGIVAGVVICLLNVLHVSYECTVDFLYDDGSEYIRKNTLRGEGRLGNYLDDGNRIDNAYSELKSGLPSPSAVAGLVRSQSALCGESESRIVAVIASARLEVLGMPDTGKGYPCRLVVSDDNRSGLDKYALFCMDNIKERLNEENKVRADKVVALEVEMMHKTEMRIKRLEQSAEDGKENHARKEELRLARQTVAELARKIDEARKRVMSRCAMRITNESPPEVSWVIRRKVPEYMSRGKKERTE